MTEEEANTKWCPMVMLEGDYSDELGANRSKAGRVPDAACCIGSDCMMWIPQKQELFINEDGRNESRYVGGYCGLAR